MAPDFSVITGGGKPRDPHEDPTRHHLRRLIVEILRATARGHDHGMRVGCELLELWIVS